MKVIRGYSTRPDHPATSPFPLTNGVLFELRGGDVCDPQDGEWFKPPYPTEVWLAYFPKAYLPYLAVKIGRFGFYFGFKIYGVDSVAYKNWIDPDEVYPGSLALCLTARFTTSLQG